MRPLTALSTAPAASAASAETSTESTVPAAPLWAGRLSEPMDDLVKRYTASITFDYRLAEADIAGSLAHAAMLQRIGVLDPSDAQMIEQGLHGIREEIRAGRFDWSLELEDVHMNIERRLTERIGDAGKRLHTGRSRNDQVATDLRLWLRGETDGIVELIHSFVRVLLDLAEREAETVMPGFTHLQVAQPVTLGHHLMAYVAMLTRDVERLREIRQRVNRLPLGAAALAGTSYPIDRAFVAEQLGFEALCENSLDAVSDRDFAIEFTGAAAILMTHLSRLAEELVLWMTPRFDFIELPDRYCTGSSIMPQKKNPDVAELIRGKTGRINGHLVALLTLMKGQPLAYNKDNQEDKEPLFDTVDTLSATLRIVSDMMAGIVVHPQAMRDAAEQGYATATDLADFLVKKGLPFRDAHDVVARVVRYAIEQGKSLEAMSLPELASFAPGIDTEVSNLLAPRGSVESRAHIGGTAPTQVRAAIARARAALPAAGAVLHTAAKPWGIKPISPPSPRARSV